MASALPSTAASRTRLSEGSSLMVVILSSGSMTSEISRRRTSALNTAASAKWNFCLSTLRNSSSVANEMTRRRRRYLASRMMCSGGPPKMIAEIRTLVSGTMRIYLEVCWSSRTSRIKRPTSLGLRPRRFACLLPYIRSARQSFHQVRYAMAAARRTSLRERLSALARRSSSPTSFSGNEILNVLAIAP